MYLGVDCSTQSLKLIVVNERGELVSEAAVIFDEHLPEYKTINGVIRHSHGADGHIEHISTPTLLFVDALEMCLETMANSGFDLSTVKAIAGSSSLSLSLCP
jgi:xylulokinase